MRVGIRGSQWAADIGGGYTFEREVFDGLVQLAGESSHRFIALEGLAPADPGAEVPANVELRAGAGIGRRALRRAVRSGLDRELSRAGIDLVWNLFPFHPSSEIPFLTIVWDLQHRLQPFFPEVSARGEWQRRERMYGFNLRRAAGIVAGTEVGRGEITTFYGVSPARIHVLPHPTPGFALAAPPSRPEALARHRLPERFILYPAQFWPHKNHVNLLRALRILRDQGIELPAVLVGSDKGNAPIVRRVAEELGLSHQVHFLGFVTTEELVALYRSARCLAYVSLFGPENLPPLEAFALGCPVVAADVSGSEEQLGDAALRVDATDPGVLASALLRACTDEPLRSTLVGRGLVRARRSTREQFVRGVFGILDGLAPTMRCWRPETGR
jgi:glycosyltransferase involved in cell wall biosynthesis